MWLKDLAADVLAALPALWVGLVLGFFYFGTLWATVRTLPNRRYPFLWILAGFLLRVAVVVVVFVALTGGEVARMFAVLVGFMITRGLLLHYWGGKTRVF
jgi:F1F0 ATPase subunit 2